MVKMGDFRRFWCKILPKVSPCWFGWVNKKENYYDYYDCI